MNKILTNLGICRNSETDYIMKPAMEEIPGEIGISRVY
jgi:hypothetical protein